MADIWFSSDWHYNHFNIIKYANRPFSNVKEMNEFLIEIHNKFVEPSDHWYNLGDVTMERDSKGLGLTFLKNVNGHKRLIMGNHDHYHVKHYMNYFEKVMAMQRFDDLWLTHVPVHPSNLGSSRANIHGHIHQNPSPPPIRFEKENGDVFYKVYINLSVEAIDYKPVNLEDLKKMVKITIEEAEAGTRRVEVAGRV